MLAVLVSRNEFSVEASKLVCSRVKDFFYLIGAFPVRSQYSSCRVACIQKYLSQYQFSNIELSFSYFRVEILSDFLMICCDPELGFFHSFLD